jgi:hypothetical protein
MTFVDGEHAMASSLDRAADVSEGTVVLQNKPSAERRAPSAERRAPSAERGHCTNRRGA